MVAIESDHVTDQKLFEADSAIVQLFVQLLLIFDSVNFVKLLR